MSGQEHSETETRLPGCFNDRRLHPISRGRQRSIPDDGGPIRSAPGQCSGEEEGLEEDGLCFLGMTGEVAFPMRILNEDKTTGGNVPDSPSLVTCSTEPSSRTES